MSFSDSIGDMIARIRNGQMAGKAFVTSPDSKLRRNVLEVLKTEGFLTGYEVAEVKKGINEIKIELKYFEGEGAIKEIKRISKPGRRVYSKSTEIQSVHNGLGISILSTSKGIKASHDARKENLGGEVICTVF